MHTMMNIAHPYLHGVRDFHSFNNAIGFWCLKYCANNTYKDAYPYLQGLRDFHFLIAFPYLQGVREGLRQSRAAPWQVSFAFCKKSFRHLDKIWFSTCQARIRSKRWRTHLQTDRQPQTAFSMFRFGSGANDGGHLVAVEVEMKTVVGEPLVGELVFVKISKFISPNFKMYLLK